jgi:hypothetical protein
VVYNDKSPRQDCHFENLQTLHLSFFDMKAVQRILQHCSDKNLKCLTIQCLGLKKWNITTTSSLDEHADESLTLTFLSNSPKSLEYFEFIWQSPPSVLSPLSYLLAQRFDWLPNLKRLPGISRDEWHKWDDKREALRTVALQGARVRGLRSTREDEDSFFRCSRV